MHGTRILAQTLAKPCVLDKKLRNAWQYHPRSDHHSKVACWGILFDLLLTSRMLVEHFATGRVAFGINHEMRDFRTGRKKNLDLVICTPGTAKDGTPPRADFRALAKAWCVAMDGQVVAALEGLPPIRQGAVGEVHIALEAKACMTEHRKARPRLYDELSSSHQTIHGSAANAIAAGFVMVNAAEEFISPGRNKWSLAETAAEISKHKQPDDTLAVIEKLKEIPRRASTQESGFDALGIVIVRLRNDGSPLEIVDTAPALDPGDVVHYDAMIRRTAKLYEARFWQV